MAVYRPPHIPSSEITPKDVWLNRRSILKSAAALGATTLAAPLAACGQESATGTSYTTNEPVTPYQDVTGYNNFYEFGLQKTDPARHSGDFNPRPWTIEVDGLVNNPRTFDIDDLIASQTIEERIYRMRCVEAWSMVIPWNGFPLSALLNQVEPLSNAKYVAFETVVRPEEMPGQRGFFQPLPWPYREGLRIDEAMHPLTILSTGVFGETLPNQNGAPVRLVVPWKYGFKGIKSIVKITLTEQEPPSTWNVSAPSEYGFYANVNPEVDHPRWSQKRERRIGDLTKRPTLPFNGYADQVAGLYAGMDLRASY